jgi:hypothetical protein
MGLNIADQANVSRKLAEQTSSTKSAVTPGFPEFLGDLASKPAPEMMGKFLSTWAAAHTLVEMGVTYTPPTRRERCKRCEALLRDRESPLQFPSVKGGLLAIYFPGI